MRIYLYEYQVFNIVSFQEQSLLVRRLAPLSREQVYDHIFFPFTCQFFISQPWDLNVLPHFKLVCGQQITFLVFLLLLKSTLPDFF